MLFEESFQCRCCGILVLAFHGNGNGIAALNAHTIKAISSARCWIYPPLMTVTVLLYFDLFDQQTGRTGMDANCFLNGIIKLLHRCVFLSVPQLFNKPVENLTI